MTKLPMQDFNGGQAKAKETKGQRTAQQILEAAARCIKKIGVEKTSVTNIAKEAGLKRSLIAYHFPRKQEIFYQVVSHIFKEISQLRAENTEGFKGRQKLEQILRTYFTFFSERSHYFNCYLHFHYLASIEDRYKDFNTMVVRMATSNIKSALIEMLEEREIHPRERLVVDTADLLYHDLIGSILRMYTTKPTKSESEFHEQYYHMLGKQIDLFLKFAEDTKHLLG